MAEPEERFVDIQDRVRDIVHQTIEGKLRGLTFDKDKVAEWTAKISEECLQGCRGLEKPFKFVANCTILQRIGAGLHTSSSCLWNSKTDGSCTVRWENESLYCIVIIYGLGI